VWWADLPEPAGAGPGFRRPVVIVSGDPFNASAIRTVVAVLLTSSPRLADAPGNVRVAAREAGLPRELVANVSQVFTVDKALLTEHTGQIPPATLARIADGLRLVLEL
jgi:mRNA interferase MazF